MPANPLSQATRYVPAVTVTAGDPGPGAATQAAAFGYDDALTALWAGQ